eukprot:2798838-Alexandrium_andersonii.AAC.1
MCIRDSLSFSTCARTRAKLKRLIWPVLRARIPTAVTARDLGAQASFGALLRSTVLRARVQKVVPL